MTGIKAGVWRALLAVLIALVAPPLNHGNSSPQDILTDKLAFWDQQRKGANSQNQTVEPDYWQAAADVGIEFIRLVPDGWKSAERDFLMRDADRFVDLAAADLAHLHRALDDAHAAGIRVVLSMFSLPGARWRQLNNEQDDSRLWREAEFQQQAFHFWHQLAAALNDHPAIVAYNPLNEPHPEKSFGFTRPDSMFWDWQRAVQGTIADVNEFNRGVVEAIREIDRSTPILLEGGFYASPPGLTGLKPVSDSLVLYGFHYYEPWEYTTFRVNGDRYSYPERMPDGGSGYPAHHIMLDTFNEIDKWAKTHDIPATRIIASEFGVDRRVAGASRYLTDVIGALNDRGWHWAFYAFRGDGAWGGMDYELGTGPLGAAFWEAVERGEDPDKHKRRGPNPLWQVISRELRTAAQ